MDFIEMYLVSAGLVFTTLLFVHAVFSREADLLSSVAATFLAACMALCWMLVLPALLHLIVGKVVRGCIPIRDSDKAIGGS